MNDEEKCGESSAFIDQGAPCIMEPDHWKRQAGQNIHVTANGFWWEGEMPATATDPL